MIYLFPTVALALLAAEPPQEEAPPEREFENHLTAQTFVELAVSANMYQIQSGDLAVTRSENPAVEGYASKMVKGHTELAEKLKKIADAQGLRVPERMTRVDSNLFDALMNAEAGKFDAPYKAQQLDAHEKAVALFERAANELENEPLKRFAREALPTLREHLTTAKAVFND